MAGTYLKLADNAETTINGNITDVADSILVSSVATLPSTFPYLLTIWDEAIYPDPSDDPSMEQVLVSGATANTLTSVTRGYGGTSGVAHVDTNRIALLITQEVFTDATYGVETIIDEHLDNASNPHTVTAAQLTGAAIKVEYEGEANTNAYTDDEKSKLTGIEPLAKDDQIASEVPNTPAGTIAATNIQAAIDELDTEKETPAGAQSKIDTHAVLTTDTHGVGSDYLAKTSKSSQIGEFVATAVVGRSGAVDYLCDGVADDVQIQAAIDSVSSIGGKVLLRSGTYIIDNMLTLSAKGVDLVGENLGGGKYTDTGSTVIKCSATFPTDEDIVYLDTNTERTSVQNIILDGNDRARDGMSLNQASNFAIFVHCRDCTRHGFYCGDNSGAGNFLDRCIVDNVGSDGIHIIRPDYRIYHAYIMRCGGAGIYLNGSSGTQIIHSHTFKNVNGVVFDHASKAVLTSCVIEQNELDAIVFDSTTGACSSNLVGNCVLYLNGQDPDEVPSAGKHVGFVSGLNLMANNNINNCSFDSSTTLINQTIANPSYMKNNQFINCVGAGTYEIEIPTNKISIVRANERIETHSDFIKSEGESNSPKTILNVDFGAENKTDTKLYGNDKNNEMFEYSNVTFTDDDKFTGINANSAASVFTSTGDILANFHTVSNCVFNFVLNQDSIVTSDVQADQQYIFKSGDINASNHPRFECYLRNSNLIARYQNSAKPVDKSATIPQETGLDNFYSIEITDTRMDFWKNGIHYGGTTLSAADRDTILNQLTITLCCTNVIGHWLDVGKLKHFEYAENLTDTEDFIKSSYAHLESKHITPKSIIPFIYEGSAAPSTAPFKIGDVFIDTTADNVYVSKDTSAASDWVRIGGIPAGNFTAPTVPASTVNYTNNFGYACQVQIKGGTVTEIDIDDIATGLTSGIFIIPNGGTLNITYSAVPTWVWWGL